MAKTVYVEAPSRLHFGFIDTCEEGRLRGSAGVALDNPVLKFKLMTDDGECVGPCADQLVEMAKECMAGECSELFVEVVENIPRHVGLGSGTQMALSAGKAAAVLQDTDVSEEDLAERYGRGKRSKVGIEAFTNGGFVISTDDSTERHDVPEEWRFVVAIPNGQQLIHGKEEGTRLKEVRALTPEEKEELISAKASLVQALEKKDPLLFGEATTRLDKITGLAFSPAQGGTHTNSLVEEGLEVAVSAGATGGGQSSWGPGFFAVAKDETIARDVALALFEYLAPQGGEVYLAGPRNSGASITVVEKNL